MPRKKKTAAPPADKPNAVDLTVECPVHRSFRVEQVAGLFDVPLEERSRFELSAELPALDEDWTIGAIVGPSGSGKSTLARHHYGKSLYDPGRWPKDKAIIDGFAKGNETRDIANLLTSVGFSSPPNWVRPYNVLSNGERFRCDLARALMDGGDLVVFDEFTSVVDRTVAKIGSAAVAKAVRRKAAGDKRFVAVSCHHDILDWLEPDWVLDLAAGKLARGRLRRPKIKLDLYKCGRAAWQLFKKTHYLTGNLAASSACYVALWDGRPVAFVAMLNNFGKVHRYDKRKVMRVSRIVVLPDFQGVGIGRLVLDAVAELRHADGDRVRITSGHPSMIQLLRRSPTWRITSVKKTGCAPRSIDARRIKARKYNATGSFNNSASTGLAVISAEYMPKSSKDRQAEIETSPPDD